MIKVIVDTEYYREQFDDWLASGRVEYKKKIYYWSAENNNYGFGWEIQPVLEEDWSKISKDKYNLIISLISGVRFRKR